MTQGLAHRGRLRLLGCLAILAVPAARLESAQSGTSDPMVQLALHQAPPLAELGPPTILVDSKGLRFVDSSRGKPIARTRLALAEAIRRARPGDVIGVRGDLGHERPIQVGGGTRGSKDYRADWKGRPIEGLAIVGLGKQRSSVIAGLELWGTYGDGSPSGGVRELRLENLSIRAAEHTRQGIIVPKGQTIGRLTVKDCNFLGAWKGGYRGFGQKWGIRGAGRASYDLRDCHCGPVQEHFLYLDSPQGDCYFVQLSMESSWRTMIQVVNRARDNPGPASRGILLMEDCHAQGIRGEGGGAFTIAGHLGAVILRNCSVRDSGHGALVIWSDANPKHGVYLERASDGTLYSTKRVLIDGFEVDLPDADRDHLQVSGCHDFLLRNFSIRGNQTGLALDSRFGVGPLQGEQLVDGKRVKLIEQRIVNGRVRVELPPPDSKYKGFQSARAGTLAGKRLGASELQAMGSLDSSSGGAGQD